MTVFLSGFRYLGLGIHKNLLIICLCLSFARAKVEDRHRSQISPEAVKDSGRDVQMLADVNLMDF